MQWRVPLAGVLLLGVSCVSADVVESEPAAELPLLAEPVSPSQSRTAIEPTEGNGPAAVDSTNEEEPGYLSRSLDYLRSKHASWSSKVDLLARRVDGFFAGERGLTEENSSYVRVLLNERWIEGGQWEPDNDLKFRLDLPATKERYHLVLTYRNNETESLEEQTLPSATTAEEGEEKSLFAGIVRTARDESKRWESKATLGIKVHIPPDPFMQFDTRRNFRLSENWSATLRGGAGWFYSSGFGAQNSNAFDYALSPNRLFRATTKLQWLEEEDNLEFAQVFDIFRTLDERRLLDYQVGALGLSSSNPHIEKYYISVIYRHDLYRKQLYFNVMPEVAYPREEGFTDVLSLSLGVEIFFNKF